MQSLQSQLQAEDEIKAKLITIAQSAKIASWHLAKLNTSQKNAFLLALADVLELNESKILEANQKDIALAKKTNVSEAMLDRLLLTPLRITQIINEVRHVASLSDPIGITLEGKLLDSGLRLEKRSVPLGVVAAIYEARPNVTIDVACLCFKTGNAVILRGGKETIHTNRVLIEIIQETLSGFGLPIHAIQGILEPDREYVNTLLKLDSYIDMLIPRGGASLHRLCKEHSTIPVITGGIGVCHIYLDNQYFALSDNSDNDRHSLSSEKIASALSIIDNAKIQRPSACNSLETLLVHNDIAEVFIPKLYHYLSDRAVTLRVCEKVATILKSNIAIDEGEILPKYIKPVTNSDYAEESLGLLLNVKIVSTIDDAIDHIRTFGTHHSDAILTQNMKTADYFIDSIDSAAIYVNASTRFTDGAQFGLGAEVAVSTQKLHARGPMGLDALTTYKWIGRGDDSIRQ